MRRLFDREVRERPRVRKGVFSWVLEVLRNRGDAYAATPLSENVGWLNVELRVASEYLGQVVATAPGLSDRLMAHLEQPTNERTEALKLHLLRVLSRQVMGSAEGVVFLSTAVNQSLRPPIRAWAWQALATTPTWQEEEAMDTVFGDPDPVVRRAALITLGVRCSSDRASRLSAEAAARRPELRFTARWVQAA